jgi:glycerate 2-kinase
MAIWSAALAAGDVAPLIARHLRISGSLLTAGDVTLDLDRLQRILVLGAGKAGGAMARAVEAILGDRIAEGFVVVKDGYAVPTTRIEVAEAGHPVPDARGLEASGRLLTLASSASERDLVLVLVSGGGSALTPAPIDGITLAEKQAVTRLLLEAGATIGELNAVRKHVSRFKGGLLARAAQPATVVTLALSDVVGDPIDVIASGPTAPDPSTYADALDVLEARGVLDRAPRSVVEHVRAGARGGIEETPKPGDAAFRRVSNQVIGNNALVVRAAATAAERLGYRPYVLTRALQGEARDVGRDLVERARLLPGPVCMIAGGETTVTVRGSGRGGRCQEAALAAALAMTPGDDLVMLAAGTDGTDGPTNSAGGVVDADTVSRGRAARRDPAHALDDNDAYGFLDASGDHVMTGPTNTNLLDLYLVLRP